MEYCRYCYEYFQNANFDTTLLYNLVASVRHGGSVENADSDKISDEVFEIRKNAKMYADTIMSELRYYKTIASNTIKKNTLVKTQLTFFERLSDLDVNEENILKVYDMIIARTNSLNLSYNKEYVRTFIKGENSLLKQYIDNYRPREEKTYKRIKSLLNSVIELKYDPFSKVSDEVIKILNDLLREKINNVDMFNEFCDKNNLTISGILEYMYQVKYVDNKLYLKCRKLYERVFGEQEQIKESKKYTKELGKECYNICLQDYYNEHSYIHHGIKNLTINQINKFAKAYAINELGMLEFEYYYDIYVLNHSRIPRKLVFFDELKKCSDNIDELIEVVKRYYRDYTRVTLYNDLLTKLISYNSIRKVVDKQKQEKIYIDLKTKIGKCREYFYDLKLKEDKRKKDEINKSKIKEAKKVIEDYVESDSDSANKYVKQNDIKQSSFQASRKIVEENDSILFARLKDKSRDNSIKNMNRLVEIAKKIILEPDIDILEYYMITKIEPNVLLNAVRNHLTNDELIKFKKITKRFYGDFVIEEKDIFSVSNSMIVNGELIEISDSQKRKALDFLNENAIPCTIRTYNSVLKKVVNEELSNPKQKKR